jgi:hypothetical protein
MGIKEANNTLMPVYHCRKPVLLGKWPLLGVGLDSPNFLSNFQDAKNDAGQ